MTNKKTIGFVIHSLNAGGAERVVTALANELINFYDIKIICLINCDSFYELNPKIKLLSCNVPLNQPKNKIKSIATHINTVKKIYNHIRHETIDIIIGFTTSANILALTASKLSGKPVIISERNNAELRPPNFFWKISRNILYKHADYLVVQTSANKAFFSRIVRDKKIIVIKNPISSNLASKRILEQTIKSEKSIITVGRLDENKSQSLLIKAFSNIANKDGWHLYIIGDGVKMAEYKQLAMANNVEKNISFMGNVSDIDTFYNNANIFVFTSKSEGFPNALAEALYYGVPSISTNCPHGPSDLIKHSYNGILIEVDDQEKLEFELKRLMLDKELRDKLRNNALKLSKELDINLISSLWMKYINKLLLN